MLHSRCIRLNLTLLTLNRKYSLGALVEFHGSLAGLGIHDKERSVFMVAVFFVDTLGNHRFFRWLLLFQVYLA